MYISSICKYFSALEKKSYKGISYLHSGYTFAYLIHDVCNQNAVVLHSLTHINKKTTKHSTDVCCATVLSIVNVYTAKFTNFN